MNSGQVVMIAMNDEPTTINDLPASWRLRADTLRRFAPAAAVAFDEAADALTRALQDSMLEPLDLATAEAESGYTRGHLRRMLKVGQLRNVGSATDPRILRGHLPRKPGYGVEPVASACLQDASLASQVVRAVAAGD
jgi:hypothetical protein